jgi:hypothetical protein
MALQDVMAKKREGLGVRHDQEGSYKCLLGTLIYCVLVVLPRFTVLEAVFQVAEIQTPQTCKPTFVLCASGSVIHFLPLLY